jgi:hypothetical protein
MKTKISEGKGGWVVQFEGESQFHVFRADEALRLVETLCKKALKVNLDVIIEDRKAQIAVERMKLDDGHGGYQ